ncbi:hypothetical protein ACHQM5_013366 [Ranunculus cassubicifolius]
MDMSPSESESGLILKVGEDAYKACSNETTSVDSRPCTLLFSNPTLQLALPDCGGRMYPLCRTTIKKMGPIVQKDQTTIQETPELSKEVEEFKECIGAEIKQIWSMFCPNRPSIRISLYAQESDTEYVGQPVKILGGWPAQLVGMGVVRDVDPNCKFGNRCVEEDNFLVYVYSALVPDIELPFPHDERTTLGQIGQGDVIWYKNYLELIIISTQ